jgi:hypothetical protein
MMESRDIKEALMYKPRWWSALLLGMFLVGMSGVSMGDRGHGGHGGHGHVGVGIIVDPFWFGPGYYPSPYYYPPYYYPPSVVTVPDSPTEYIEREDSVAPAPQASAYWYYCADPQGYYPYVKQCPGGWQAVAPQPDTVPREER